MDFAAILDFILVPSWISVILDSAAILDLVAIFDSATMLDLVAILDSVAIYDSAAMLDLAAILSSPLAEIGLFAYTANGRFKTSQFFSGQVVRLIS